ncbi:MAG: L,D-transpeptidase [Pseudonocardiaceae bacterium]
MIRVFRHTVIALTVTVGCAVLTPAVAAAAAQSAAAPCGPSAAACVSLSSQRAWLMSGGQVTYGPTPIATGKPGWRTPPGVFRVLWKNKNHRSRQFNNAPMPNSVFFTSTGIAFHEGSVNAPSHGCVRLSKKAAATFFNTLSVGQVVQVVN